MQSLAPVCMAMHVHACASEGPGSMAAQLVQAQLAGVDVLWWTEHDHRMTAHYAPGRLAMSGLEETSPDMAPWTWTPVNTGNPLTTRHDFVTADAHHELGGRAHALRLAVSSNRRQVGRHFLSGQAENFLNRTSLQGLTISIDVLPQEVSESGYVGVEVVTSYRPEATGQPEGVYSLSYRVGGGSLPGVSKRIDETSALVSVAAPTGAWTTITLTPQLDLARLWPGVDGRDASLHALSLVANAIEGHSADAHFADLRFSRTQVDSSTALAAQRELMASYAAQFPTVQQLQGLEISLTIPHLCWYGGTVTLPDLAGLGPLPSHDLQVAVSSVQAIHDGGGIASYCHPFGTTTTAIPAPDQEIARAAKASELIRNRALGCDLLEVGYRLRGGCTLVQHESLWDNCSRNAIFLTGVGVSDDHAGRDWIDNARNFATWAWAADKSEAALVNALRTGHAYFGDLALFRGAIDLRVDGQSVMGGVRVVDAETQSISLLVAGLPSGGTVDVLVGHVDLAGADDTQPTIRRSRLSEGDFDEADTSTIEVDTTRSCFVRLVVSDSSGKTAALSNPVWLLRERTKITIPDNRKL